MLLKIFLNVNFYLVSNHGVSSSFTDIHGFTPAGWTRNIATQLTDRELGTKRKM